MDYRLFMFLIGAMYFHHQSHAADGDYFAELMVESNVTVKVEHLISILNNITKFLINGTINVTMSGVEVTSECVIIGYEYSCNCSEGYIWSNNICYKFNCCDESPCNHNVSYENPLCIPKVEVHFNGSATLTAGTWNQDKTNELKNTLKTLNGIDYLNITGQREENTTVDFEAGLSVKFPTHRLQERVNDLETSLGAVLKIVTLGFVAIKAPNLTVKYESSQELTCLFEEPTHSAGWNMSGTTQRFELNTGSVVTLDDSCHTEKYSSCAKVNLNGVTGIWAGTYECGFTIGSVRHTAKTQLKVALLPDVIHMKIKPLTVNCSMKSESESVAITVTATILNSTERFKVKATYMKKEIPPNSNSSEDDDLVFTFTVNINCKKTTGSQSVVVTFKNHMEQNKTETVHVPVIYKGEQSCKEDYLNGEVWPDAPDGGTVVNHTCPAGRVGYKTRACKGTEWQPVFSSCVNEELSKISNKAENFLMGLGATQAVAMHIFLGLKNNSMYDSSESQVDTMADISASINILDVMSRASENVTLQEDVFPDMVEAASNMLNKSWEGANVSTVQTMSAKYIESVETLVKNIEVNTSTGVSSQSLDLKFCSSEDCHVSVFDTSVNLKKSNGMMKTIAVKNIMDKLRNDFRETETTKLLVSVTREPGNDSDVEISLIFPSGIEKGLATPFCVFWKASENNWSDKGCTVTSKGANHTACKCDHLTSFSVLMSKSDISTPELDMITKVGLAVSVGCLLIFLIIESLVWRAVTQSNLSHFRHTALVNIAVFLLLADCSFLASTSPESLSEDLCFILTVCKHLFFLAMFSWMLCMSVMLVHQLIFVFSPLRKRVFMFLSSIIGYVCPILIVGSSYVYCKYTERPYHHRKTCWLVYERLLEGSIHAFLLPVGTITLTNLFSMVVVIVTLTKTSVPDSSKARDKETAKGILKVVLFLTPVFGLTWIIGFALLMLEPGTVFHTVADYSFTILNSFQGLFLLATGCLTEQKVRDQLLKLVKGKTGKSESTTNLTSATNMKDK